MAYKGRETLLSRLSLKDYSNVNVSPLKELRMKRYAKGQRIQVISAINSEGNLKYPDIRDLPPIVVPLFKLEPPIV